MELLDYVRIPAVNNVGIGGFDLASSADRVFAFDYNSSGKLDHLVLYRPGTGTLWILKNNGGANTTVTFSPVYAEGDPGNGIGGFDLASPATRVFAFDYNSSGKLDHLVLYTPGTGTLWILRNNGGAFSPVYAEGDPGNGIGGFDLASPATRAFAFDYNSSGKQDHLVLYTPGTGTLWILRNNGGAFSPVYAEGDPGVGIDDSDLASSVDQALAFDYSGDGKADHLVLYRPGARYIHVLRQEPAVPPTIADFSPNEGVPGDTVVIRGNSLRRTRRVEFSGRVAKIIKTQNKWVSVTVPPNVDSGSITLKTPVGYATTSIPFLVLPPPFIESIAPTSGKVGTDVKITGTNFKRVSAVRFNGVQANFDVITDITITASVPGNATDGTIKVICAGGTATSSEHFHVEVTVPRANLGFTGHRIRRVSATPEDLKVGEPFAVHFDFTNGGTAATGDFFVRIELKRDDGNVYGDIPIPSYAPGADGTAFWEFPVGLPAGSHPFYAYLDIYNQVTEIDETNNFDYMTVYVEK